MCGSSQALRFALTLYAIVLAYIVGYKSTFQLVHPIIVPGRETWTAQIKTHMHDRLYLRKSDDGFLFVTIRINLTLWISIVIIGCLSIFKDQIDIVIVIQDDYWKPRCSLAG